MTKPKTLGEILDFLKDRRQQDNQLDLEATEYQLIASPENTKLGDGNPVMFMSGGDPARMMGLTMAAITEAFKKQYGEENALKHLRRLFDSMAKAFIFIGQNSFEDHCGHDINRIAAEVFKEHSKHLHPDETPTFQSEEVDDFDRLLQQTLDSLHIDSPATRSTLNDFYSGLGIVFDATRIKQ